MTVATSITEIEAGWLRLDGGAMFGSIPKAVWSRFYPADDQNRIRLAMRLLLVRGPGYVALLDSGMGDDWSALERDRLGLETPPEGLDGRLAAHGVAVEDVTDVMITHLHFDHAAGVLRREADGTQATVFPRARVHVQRANWRWACEPNARECGSYRGSDFRPLESLGQLELLDGPGEVLPGIEVLVSDGHTVGQQMFVVRDGRRTVFYPGDLIPTTAHLRLAWTMGYDIHALKVVEEKTVWLERACREGWIVCFDHDPGVAAATITADEKGRGYRVLDPVSLTGGVEGS